MRRDGVSFSAWSALLAAVALVIVVLLRPDPLPDSFFDGLTRDVDRGAFVFAAAGCASCHTAPDAEPSDAPVLAGGRTFASPFGTFVAPNISSGSRGLGTWSDIDIANAILLGEGPDRTHLYPALPYAAYRNMTRQDAYDLIAYLRTLPSAITPSQPHDVGFPFNIRLGIGVWKKFFNRGEWVLETVQTAEIERGRYLVEVLGHCGECHTPRNFMGGLDRKRWLGGAPNPAGKGQIPNITSGKLGWSEDEIVDFLKTGFTPEFDSAGGQMAEVISGLSKLPQSDLEAIAAYLKAVPALD